MIVVTGGAGFIGSNLIYALNQRGEDKILVVDSLKRGEKVRNLTGLRIYDFIDREKFLRSLKSFKKVEVIFHLGACTDTTNYDGKFMMENNYEYSKEILFFCQENKIRLIYASSASVYGDKNCFEERRECERPLNVYAYSKFLFDEFVRRQNLKTQVVGIRYFNVYGPNEKHKGKMASVINQFFYQVRKEGKLKLFEGSEKFFRDFIYVKDCVKVNLFFYENPQISGIFNCGTGRARSFYELSLILLNELKKYGIEGEVEFIPFPESLKGKYQEYTCASLKRLREAGYEEEFTPLEEGIRDYLKFLVEKDGYLL